jgi:hypothetical protein
MFVMFVVRIWIGFPITLTNQICLLENDPI